MAGPFSTGPWLAATAVSMDRTMVKSTAASAARILSDAHRARLDGAKAVIVNLHLRNWPATGNGAAVSVSVARQRALHLCSPALGLSLRGRLGRGVRPAVNARCPGKPLAQEHAGRQELVCLAGAGVKSCA